MIFLTACKWVKTTSALSFGLREALFSLPLDVGLSPTDPVILQKMGVIFDNEGDKQQAYQYHFDSYRYFPSNLEVIDWLGSYFIEMQVS